MSGQGTCDIPTCATYDQYVESQLMKEFIANNVLSAKREQEVHMCSPVSQRLVDTTLLSDNEKSRIGSTIVIPAAATQSYIAQRYYIKELRRIKYVKRLTSIGVWSQKIKKLKYEILLLEDMEMIMHERMEDFQENYARTLHKDGVGGWSLCRKLRCRIPKVNVINDSEASKLSKPFR